VSAAPQRARAGLRRIVSAVRRRPAGRPAAALLALVAILLVLGAAPPVAAAPGGGARAGEVAGQVAGEVAGAAGPSAAEADRPATGPVAAADDADGRPTGPPPARVAYELIFLSVAGLLTAVVLIVFLFVVRAGAREAREERGEGPAA